MLKVTQGQGDHIVSDFRRVYFRGSEIDCQRFIVRTTMKVERIVIMDSTRGGAYRVYTNLGVTDVEQNCDADSLYDTMFYTVDYGTIVNLSLREVLIETLAWDLSINDWFKREEQAKAIAPNIVHAMTQDISEWEMPDGFKVQIKKD